jgi:hypothetical protein
VNNSDEFSMGLEGDSGGTNNPPHGHLLVTQSVLEHILAFLPETCICTLLRTCKYLSNELDGGLANYWQKALKRTGLTPENDAEKGADSGPGIGNGESEDERQGAGDCRNSKLDDSGCMSRDQLHEIYLSRFVPESRVGTLKQA